VQGRKRLEQIPLGRWGARRRKDLLVLLDQLNQRVDELTAAVQQEAEKRPEARLLMTHPGVGPVTALAFVLIVGYRSAFHVESKSEATSGSSQPNPPAAFIDGFAPGDAT